MRNRILKNRIAGGFMFTITVASILLVVLIGLGLYVKSLPIFEHNSFLAIDYVIRMAPGERSVWLSAFYCRNSCHNAYCHCACFANCVVVGLVSDRVFKIIFEEMGFHRALDILAGIRLLFMEFGEHLFIVPWISEKLAPHFVEYSTGYTVLAGGIVLGVMILPFVD